MIEGLPYGPIRPKDLDSFTYYAGNKYGYLRHIRYRCVNPEGKKPEPTLLDSRPSPWEQYVKSISSQV